MTTHVVAMGGGGFSTCLTASALDKFCLSLAPKSEPVVCFVPTASGDSTVYVERFLAAFEPLRCRPTILSLFQRSSDSLREILEMADVIYVGGGSTANLLNLWRLHGLDRALAQRAESNSLVVAGPSAGALCWFEGGITDSFGPFKPLQDGLGWLRGSFCPHYDSEPHRRPVYREAISQGVLSPGWAADDGTALHFVDGVVRNMISEQIGSAVYRVELSPAGVQETSQDVEVL